MLLLALTVGVLVGTAMGLWMTPPLPSFGAVVLALLLSACGIIATWGRQPARWAGIVLLAAVLSGARAQVDRAQLESSALPVGLEGVRGLVAGVPRGVGRASAFIVEVDEVLYGGHWENRLGRVEARTFGWVPAEDDRVEIIGEPRLLVDIPGAPRATLLRRQRVTQDVQVERMRLLASSTMQGGRFNPGDLRIWMEDRINAYLDVPHSALLAGLLLGSRSELSPEVRSLFAQTGTSHIVAVSGFNVVIVSGFVLAVLARPLGVRASALAAMLAVLAYTLIVGAPASAVRAAIMAGGALTARIIGRPSDAMSGLMFAGACMALADPLVLQDLGFQLSMLATGGLILLIPAVTRERTWRDHVGHLMMTPLAAQIATLPLVLHTFHSLSLIALVANVVVALFLPIAMAMGGLLILVSGIELLAIPVSWLAWLAASGVLEPVRFFASLPGAWLATGAFPLPAMLGSYLAILLWVVQRSPELRGLERARRLARVAAPIVLGLCLLSLIAPARPTSQLSGELLEFGNLMIASSPSGKMLVVGTDVSPQVLTAAVAERLPFWKRSIDVVILSDDAPASWRGVQAIGERYDIEFLVTPGSSSVGVASPRIGRIVEASEETLLDLGDNTTVRVLPPSPSAQTRTRVLPLAVSYGVTGVSFPARGADPSLTTNLDGWIMVVRDGVALLDGNAAMARVRWDRSANQSGKDRGILELTPRADGPITFASDGYQLTIHWSGCNGPDSSCSTVIGGTSRDQ